MARSSLDSITLAQHEHDDCEVVLRLIYKGKTIARECDVNTTDTRPAFSPDMTLSKDNLLKVVVMSAPVSEIRELNSSRSDPLIRGFDDERKSNKSKDTNTLSTFWGALNNKQHTTYKFCRFQECTDASFGTRPGSSTPHAFEARRLLERLATDPGVVTILTSRELLVGTLGEMDPIDDRIAQQMEHEGGRVLGYNTNFGMRIDIKLRTDDLSGFRPYKELASTLIHELSHNWVGDHTVLFWTNYGQMRVEYLWKHARLMRGGVFVSGKRTATLAGITDMIQGVSSLTSNTATAAGRLSRGEVLGGNNDFSTKVRLINHICRSVIEELVTEMAQHRIPVQLVAPSIITFGEELMNETKDEDVMEGHILGGINTTLASVGEGRSESATGTSSAKECALAAAERRALEAKKKENDKCKEKIED